MYLHGNKIKCNKKTFRTRNEGIFWENFAVTIIDAIFLFWFKLKIIWSLKVDLDSSIWFMLSL